MRCKRSVDALRLIASSLGIDATQASLAEACAAYVNRVMLLLAIPA